MRNVFRIILSIFILLLLNTSISFASRTDLKELGDDMPRFKETEHGYIYVKPVVIDNILANQLEKENQNSSGKTKTYISTLINNYYGNLSFVIKLLIIFILPLIFLRKKYFVKKDRPKNYELEYHILWTTYSGAVLGRIIQSDLLVYGLILGAIIYFVRTNYHHIQNVLIDLARENSINIDYGEKRYINQIDDTIKNLSEKELLELTPGEMRGYSTKQNLKLLRKHIDVARYRFLGTYNILLGIAITLAFVYIIYILSALYKLGVLEYLYQQ